MTILAELGFSYVQKDNIRNQRENVILIVANAQSGLGIPVEADPVSYYLSIRAFDYLNDVPVSLHK